jgi:hypothetical protein
VIGQGGYMKISLEVTWRGNGRHMSGGERRRCDNRRGINAQECEWMIGVSESAGGMGWW